MKVIEIPIPPTAQKRARSAIRGRFVQVYKDKGQKDNEHDIMSFLAQHRPDMPAEGPIKMHITARFELPKSRSKKLHEQLNTMIPMPHAVKPDADNLAKQILDCMTKLRFWLDDKQVFDLTVVKLYSKNPGWVIAYFEFGGEGVKTPNEIILEKLQKLQNEQKGGEDAKK